MKKWLWVLFVMAFLFLAAPTLSGANWYVDSDMADDTGDGTSWATAEKTLVAALAECAAGDTITIDDGTYAEDSNVATYEGCLVFNRDFSASPVTIQAKTAHSGTTWNVVLKPAGSGTPTSDYILFGQGANIGKGYTFSEIEFQPYSGAGECIQIVGAVNKLTFKNCHINNPGTAAGRRALHFVGTANAYMFSFQGCRFTGASNGNAAGSAVLYTDVSTKPNVDVVVFRDCTVIAGAGCGLVDFQYGLRGLIMDNCTFTQTGTLTYRAFTIGVDGSSNQGTAGVVGAAVKNCTINTASSSHACLLGANVDGGQFVNNVVNGTASDYGLAIKAAVGVRVAWNFFNSPNHGIISRASYNPVICNNVLLVDQDGITIDEYMSSAPTYGTGNLGEIYNNIIFGAGTNPIVGINLINYVKSPNVYCDYNCTWNTGTGGAYPLHVSLAEDATMSDNGSGKVRITKTGRFVGVADTENCMVDFYDTYTDKTSYSLDILAATDNYIDVDVSYAAGPTINLCNVAGTTLHTGNKTKAQAQAWWAANYGSEVGYITNGAHDVVENPMFAETTYYSLKGGSPCLNAGRPSARGGYSTIGWWQSRQVGKVNEFYGPANDLYNSGYNNLYGGN